MTSRQAAQSRRVRATLASGAVLTVGALALASCASPGASGADSREGPSLVAIRSDPELV